MKLHILPALKDNYIYVLEGAASLWIVDPGEAEPVINFLKSAIAGQNQTPTINILLTHHHNDHTGGVEELKTKYSCSVWGPDDSRMPFVDHPLTQGQRQISGQCFSVLETPGHTVPALSYFLNSGTQSFLLCGDTLFAGGCGRLFEGSAAQMWHSIKKFTTLPEQTQICAAHEYTEANYKFVATLNWNSSSVLSHLEEIKTKRNAGLCTYPVSLKIELELNPFLNADSALLKRSLGLSESCPDTEAFATLRTQKDHF